MVGFKLGGALDLEGGASEGSGTSIAECLETIGLLQDEVARLERELQARDEALSSDEGSRDDAAAAPVDDVRDEREIERFKKELASRDETIQLLLDALSRDEEERAAERAEWDHLASWVAELERRVESQNGDGVRELENRLAAQERKAESSREKAEHDRQGWDALRQSYQEEITRLQGALGRSRTPDDSAENADGPAAAEIESLQTENLRLRAERRELLERASAADRSEALDAKLAEALDEQGRLHGRIEQLQDESRRERLEHEAAAAEFEARAARTAPTAAREPSLEERAAEISPTRDIDLRVRALRQHLLEIDEQKKEERNQKRLVSRLSRLWSLTGPR